MQPYACLLYEIFCFNLSYKKDRLPHPQKKFYVIECFKEIKKPK